MIFLKFILDKNIYITINNINIFKKKVFFKRCFKYIKLIYFLKLYFISNLYIFLNALILLFSNKKVLTL